MDGARIHVFGPRLRLKRVIIEAANESWKRGELLQIYAWRVRFQMDREQQTFPGKSEDGIESMMLC